MKISFKKGDNVCPCDITKDGWIMCDTLDIIVGTKRKIYIYCKEEYRIIYDPKAHLIIKVYHIEDINPLNDLIGG